MLSAPLWDDHAGSVSDSSALQVSDLAPTEIPMEREIHPPLHPEQV